MRNKPHWRRGARWTPTVLRQSPLIAQTELAFIDGTAASVTDSTGRQQVLTLLTVLSS